MQQKKYESLLKGNLKPLGNFVDQALQHQVPYDMFRILCLNCVPFLHKEPIFNQLHEKWFQERNDYYRIYKQKEKEAVEQIKNTYHIIQERIVLKNLQKNRKIVQALQNVEQVLNGQDKCCIPPYYETASTQIVNLFRLLLLKKKPQLLEGLAEFQNVAPSSKPLLVNFFLHLRLMNSINSIREKIGRIYTISGFCGIVYGLRTGVGLTLISIFKVKNFVVEL